MLYAIAIVYMAEYGVTGAILIQISCLAQLCFICNFWQWKDSIVNLQHFVSEAALYAILALQISCACVSDSEFRHEAGKWIILIATLTVIWNMAICVKIGVHQVKLLKQRRQNISKISAANLVKDFRFSLDTKQESQQATTQQDQ